METRRSEWLASIKPILDRDGAKKDAVALAKELGDILEIKVDANPENLDELAREFNAQLKTMGKQPIVFSEKTLRGIVSQFTKAISEGISAGVAKVDFSAQLEELNKKREKILKAQNRANQAMKARTRMERLENFSINTAELMPIDGDVAKEAQRLIDILYDSAKKIDQAAQKYGKSSSHYTSAVMDAQEAYNKYLRMQKTLGAMPPSRLATIPKDVRALYDRLGQDREGYEIGGGMNIPFEETFEAEKILDSFEELSDVFESVVDDAARFDKMLKQIDAQIEEITRRARESGGVDGGILSGAKDGLKTLNEIEAAYKRLKVNKGTKLRQQSESHIKSALDFDPTASKEGIKTLYEQYQNAAISGDWVEEYRALLKYVKLYESYLASTNKTHQNKVTAKNNPFTPLYEQLKPMAENAQNMLQNILNMGEGRPLVGMGGADKEEVSTGPTSEDVANAQKVSVEAEKTAEADKVAADATARKRVDEEKIAEASRKAAEAAEREFQAKEKAARYIAHRAIEPPKGSGKTKSDALEDWGGEYWSTEPSVAKSYGENFNEKGHIIIGEITPKKPLIINAQGLRWDEFDKMPGIKELFPEILEMMKQPGYIGDDGQKHINNRAKEMGYDAVIFENVNDALDGDKVAHKLTTTIAVLDDKIVSLVGSMEQLKAGTSKFSDKISPEIPSYYISGSPDNGDASAQIQDVGTAFKRLIDYINNSGQSPKKFFDNLVGGTKDLNGELQLILSSLGLLNEQGNVDLKSIQNGFMNLGGMVSDTYTLIARSKDYLPKAKDLMPKLMDAKQMGANVGTILEVIEDEAHGKIYELQSTVAGEAIKFSGDAKFLEATDEQILKLIQDLEILKKAGLYIDFGGDNIFYDKEKGFSFIDLATRPKQGQEAVEDNVQKMLKFFGSSFGEDARFGGFSDRVSTTLEASMHRDNADAIQEEVEAQERLNQVKKGQSYSGTLYHGSKTPMNDVTYDPSQGKGLKNLGSGLYLTPDLEQAAKHGKHILQQNVQLENIFTLTEDFITDIDALYKAMGKVKPVDVDWKTIKSDLLNTMRIPGKAQEFAKNMRDMGYQGMYSKGYGYGDPNVEQLVVYDEQYQQNLTTRPYEEIMGGTADVQAETAARKENTEAIVAQTQAQEKLNAEKTEGQQITVAESPIVPEIQAETNDAEIDDNKRKAISYDELRQKVEAYLQARELMSDGKTPMNEAVAQIDAARKAITSLFPEKGKSPTDVFTSAGVSNMLSNSSISEEHVHSLARALGIEIPQATQQAKQAVDGLNNELQTTGDNADNIDSKIGDDSIPSTGMGQTAGTTPEKAQNLETVRAKVAEITAAVEAKTKAFKNEGVAVNDTVDGEIAKLTELEEKVTKVKTAIEGVKTGSDNESTAGQIQKPEVINVDEQENENLVALKKTVDAVTTAVNAKTQAFTAEETEVKRVVKSEIDSLDLLKQKLAAIKTTSTLNAGGTSAGRGAGTGRQGQIERLIKLYQELGQLEAQDAVVESEMSRLNVRRKQEEIREQERLITLTSDEINLLAQKRSAAVESELDLLNAKAEDIAVEKDRRQIIRELIDLYKQLGEASAINDTGEVSRLDAEIMSRRHKLTSTAGEEEGKFDDARETAYSKKREDEFKKLEKLYQELGEVQARYNQDGSAEAKQRIDQIYKEIDAIDDLIKLSQQEVTTLEDLASATMKAENDNLDAKRQDETRRKEIKELEKDAKKYGALIARRERVQDDNPLAAELDKQILALEQQVEERSKLIDLLEDEQRRLNNISTQSYDETVVKLDEDAATKKGSQDQTERKKQLKDLEKLYQDLGKTQAQYERDGSAQAKDHLEWLRAKIAETSSLIELSQQEVATLEELAAATMKTESAKLDAKAQDAAWKKQVKDAQRATGINAATSAINAGNDTVLRAIGTEGVSAEIEQKAQELSTRITELKQLRDAIAAKGEKADESDKKLLSEQIARVKELKTELSGYLTIHEKYKDADDLGDASNFGTVGTDEYWNNITAAIQASSKSKVVIKGLNADTGELTGTTKIAANTFATWSATVDPITGRLSMLRTGIKKTETMIESITRKTKEIFTYFSGSSIIFKFFNEFKRGIQYVREIDLAMTELKKVTDETEETYDEFLKTAAKTADKVGSTIQKVVSSTADWARLNI